MGDCAFDFGNGADGRRNNELDTSYSNRSESAHCVVRDYHRHVNIVEPNFVSSQGAAIKQIYECFS
jgi:hypothetical protein